jgi:hypothetical protein
MALNELLSAADGLGYQPRTLELHLPPELTKSVSLKARAFLEIAFGKQGYTILELTGDAWKDDQVAVGYFHKCDPDVQLEILTFITLFVHELTHRIDFLISPFGLQYYVNTLREYWHLQEFVPQVLDDPETIDSMRFIVGLSGDVTDREEIKGLWTELKGIIHNFYAWGDASNVVPLGKYAEEGWSDDFKGASDLFGVGIDMEPITLLRMFHTFRVSGKDKFWYLRPLTIFETKAIVNSLLFILHLFGNQGPEICHRYYERVYLQRKKELPQDYFFVLDLGARLYGANDFEALLKLNNPEMLKSTLLILSTICWYALQAPPFLKGQDQRIGNPILRFWACFMFWRGIVRRTLHVQFTSSAEALAVLDDSKQAAGLYAKPIGEVLLNCRKAIDNMIELNEKRTWHPDVLTHFRHIFALMRPHFADREPTYSSLLGMPDNGNPLLGCRSKEDWELTYDDYKTPPAVKEWLNIRTDLFFTMVKPGEDMIERLASHFQAFFLPYKCQCGQGMTAQWVSRFLREYHLKCAFCGETKTLRRDDMTFV